MDQLRRRLFLINELQKENENMARLDPEQMSDDEQKRLLRSLMNVRMPAPVSDAFLAIQDAYLKEAISEKGITDLAKLHEIEPDLYLWQGDITTLRCGAIVNAANAELLGCFHPCHNCIDNAIHTYSGVQLRLFCHELMQAQGHPEPTGSAKLTPAFNLPCDRILHTVGPIVSGRLTDKDRKQLESCYRACLTLAADHGIESIAFCCISTGVFGFPKREAARIAVETVKRFKKETESGIKVIFNVFSDEDLRIYRAVFGAGSAD